ncbi:hypothetical protein [Microvirga sp. 2TAF3]|uniref:hypothetical protein n=1 Tax=Microvirga sp. 2TAF3 TaxID=3233014 RepID=UPI003F971665
MLELKKAMPITPLPLSATTLATAHAGTQGSAYDRERVRAILGIDAIFGTDLPRDARFENVLISAYTQLLARGARAAAAEFNSDAGA